ncbi:MAG: methyl-accepting chemotaxis protein [Syntrophomonadaceae bacterium]
MKNINSMGIRQKFGLIMGISFFMVGVFLFFYFPLNQKSEMNLSQKAKAQVMAKMVAKTSAAGLLFDESSSVSTLLEAFKEMSDVEFAMVLKKDGSKFASFNDSKYTKYSSKVGEMISQKSLSYSDDDIQLEIYTIRSNNEAIGSVVIGLSKSEILSSVDSSRITSFLISLVIFLLGLGSMQVFFTRVIYNPIRSLKTIADKLSVGDVAVTIELDRKDEIGMLERSFVSIVDSIKEQSNVAGLISDGNLQTAATVKSDNDILSKSMNKVIETLRSLINEVASLTKSASEGRLSERGNAKAYNGGYREIVQGMNDTLDAVILPIKEGVDALEKMATGDLTVRIHSTYNGDHQLIKNSINSVAGSLSNILMDVNEAISATASAASEISSSSEQMAAGAHEQSQQTNDVAGAVEQMTKTILESTEYSAKAAENSRLASDNAKEGAKKVEHTKKGMLRIVESTKVTGDKITSLARKTDQIGEIAQVIDDIADQTNLLALNAAIEAARAGEQGRGFAVVADEVRKLAERTTKATKEIADTIKAIQNEAKEADKSMNEAGAAVEEGMKLTEDVALSLNKILEVNQNVSDIVSQVAAASEEESSAAEEISKNIDGISSVTQQSESGTEQIARAAEDLNRLTVNLQELVSRFKLSEDADRHSANRFGVKDSKMLAGK